MVFPLSNRKGVGLWRFAAFPLRGAFQGFNSAGFIKVEHGVKLVGKRAMKVMARPLGLRPVNDPDGSLQALVAQSRPDSMIPHGDHESWHIHIMEEGFVTSPERRANPLPLRRLIPVRRCRHRAAKSCVAYQERMIPIPLTDQLTQV